jgi:hypothetical protein
MEFSLSLVFISVTYALRVSVKSVIRMQCMVLLPGEK